MSAAVWAKSHATHDPFKVQSESVEPLVSARKNGVGFVLWISL